MRFIEWSSDVCSSYLIARNWEASMIFRTTTGRSTRTRFALGASLIALGGAVGIALPATAFAQETPAPDAGQDDSGDGGIIVTGQIGRASRRERVSQDV